MSNTLSTAAKARKEVRLQIGVAAKQHWRVYHTDRLPDINYFRVESSFKPSHYDLALEQRRMGFDPLGYGGPENIETTHSHSTFVTTWSCGNSCD